MDQGVISFEKLFSKNDSDEPIAVASTFYGEEYTDRSAYLKLSLMLDSQTVQPRNTI